MTLVIYSTEEKKGVLTEFANSWIKVTSGIYLLITGTLTVTQLMPLDSFQSEREREEEKEEKKVKRRSDKQTNSINYNCVAGNFANMDSQGRIN